MENKTDQKIELKDKIAFFYNKNKSRVYFFVIILFVILISLFFFQFNVEKKNNLISDKYIKAGLYLASDQKNKSVELYSQIILSKNKFYSILALNQIIENSLETNEKKILNYFIILEKLNISKEQNDLLIFKKALYFIKNSNQEEGKQLLKSLIESNSKLKTLAENILAK
jgi:hypothetical protein